MFGYFYAFNNIRVFACVQTWLKSGLIFVFVSQSEWLHLVLIFYEIVYV